MNENLVIEKPANDSLDRHLLETFDDAIEKGYIQVYYQPVVRTISRQACGVEALARWNDPQYGLIQPYRFISLLEQNHLIHRLDACVIRQACEQMRQVIDEGLSPIPTSVNLSRLDFELCDIVSIVERCVADYRLPRNLLHIEITESVFADHPELMRVVLKRFRGAGYQVWMDDFGSGYSSLNVLKDYDFDELKVDMVFLSSFHLRSRKILTAVIEMAKNIGIHTLCEGVETEEQFRYLHDIGCEKVQGYLFGKPSPYRDMIENLRRNHVPIEFPQHRYYYEKLGMINLLGSAPFMTAEERSRLTNARDLNSIPLALVELRESECKLLYYNTVFEKAAGETLWGREIFSGDMTGVLLPVSRLPKRFLNMLEEARSTGRAKLHFISNGDYFEFQARLSAQAEGVSGILLRLDNLSGGTDRRRMKSLDADIRHIYSVFDRVVLLELAENRCTPMYVDGRDNAIPSDTLGDVIRCHAEELIFQEDRPAFLRFYDVATMESRITASGSSHIVDFFRTWDQHGQYVWKQYLLVWFRPGAVISLVRNSDEDVHVMRERFLQMYPLKPRAELTDGRLWKSFVQSDLQRVCWLDENRRYVGTSKGFLTFFGFSSPAPILERTNEELGWFLLPEHIINSELRVLRDGIAAAHIPAEMIVGGVIRKVLYSNAPVFNEYGRIIGLMCCIEDYDAPADADAVPDLGTRDGLTGMLNTRGFAEALSFYADQYYLRGADYLRVHISIEDFEFLALQYGHSHCDKIIAALGKELGRLCGNAAVLARMQGPHFAILRHSSGPADIPRVISALKDAASRLGLVDGVPVEIYISVGVCAMSEGGSVDRQEQLATARMHEDHARYSNFDKNAAVTAEMFRMYDKLPLSFAVYEVKLDPETDRVEAYYFYVNARFALEQDKKPSELIGRSVRDTLPTLEDEWFDMAQRAAYLSEDIIADNVYYACMNTHYRVTVSQILRQGFCVFTYMPLDGPFAAGNEA